MSGTPPEVSVIVAVRPGDGAEAAVEGLRHCDFPRDRFEVLLASGTRPSRQRNLAAARARGRILFFLDDDSVIDPDALARLEDAFVEESIAAVGGPSLRSRNVTPLQRLLADLMESPLAFGPSCNRYRQSGQPRDTTEKELILCNLAIRRDLFTRLGGFDECLYPNEENALLDRLQREGGRLRHDPGLVVRRQPRATIGAYLLMLLRYGRGRGEQMRRHPGTGSMANLLPALFVLSLLLIPLMVRLHWSLVLPHLSYALLVLGFACRTGPRRGMLAAFLVVAGHILYGLGVWKGILSLRPVAAREQDRTEEIRITRVDLALGRI